MFRVKHLTKEGIKIVHSVEDLYVYKMESDTERIITANERAVKRILERSKFFQKEGWFYIVINKKKTVDKFMFEKDKVEEEPLFKIDIYFLTHIDDFARELGLTTYRKLKGEELVRELYKIITLQEVVYIDRREYKLKSSLQVEKPRNMLRIPLEILQAETPEERIMRYGIETIMSDIDNYKVYIGAYPSPTDKVLWNEIFNADWEGSLWLCFNVNNPLSFLKARRIGEIDKERIDKWTFLIEEYEKGELSLGRIIPILITRKDFDNNEKSILDTFKFLGFYEVIDVASNKKDYLLSTPILYTDIEYETLKTEKELKNYIIISGLKQVEPEKALLWGQSKRKNFVNFNLFCSSPQREANLNPHFTIIAPSGAGKSFNLELLIVQALNLDLQSLYFGEEEYKKYLRNNIRVRYFDKGYSAELLFKLMEHRGLEVGIFATNIDEVSFNVIELEELKIEEILFSLNLINTILEIKQVEPIKGIESSLFQEALKALYSPENQKTWLSKGMEIIALGKKMDFVLEKIKEEDYTLTPEQIAKKYPEFANIDKPLIGDLKKLLADEFMRKYKDDPEMIKHIRSLMEKLEVLTDTIFDKPTRLNLKNAKYFYMDIEKIRDNEYFIPIMLAIIKKLVDLDKKSMKKDEYALYVFDEAHNLFMLGDQKSQYAVETLLGLMKRLSKEARKFRISLGFATQEIQDLPLEVINNSNTMMLLVSASKDKNAQVFDFLKKSIGDSIENFINFAQTEAEMFRFFIQYGRGIFTMKFPINNITMAVLSTDPKASLELPDGTILKKTYA